MGQWGVADRRSEIVEAALAVAQENGLAAMSMRAVADRVGVSVMALYRHVPTKEALLDELVGRLLAEIEPAAPDTPWQQRLRDLAGQVYALAGRYPTVVPLLLTRAYSAPPAVRVVTGTSALLRDAGVAESDVPRLERMVATFLLGYATSAVNNAFWSDPAATQPPPAPAPPAPAPAGATQHSWQAELDRDVTDLITLLDHVAKNRRSGTMPPPPLSSDAGSAHPAATRPRSLDADW